MSGACMAVGRNAPVLARRIPNGCGNQQPEGSSVKWLTDVSLYGAKPLQQLTPTINRRKS